ncbi:MAG TPA: Uma2 family endonuclease [Blastocatellia bacterium]|nr:Uma2 family endonuclease [Blastocatellia bacterium]
MNVLPKKRYTLEEYLELDRRSEERYEFFDGEVFAMAGGSIEHSAISMNIARALGNRLEDRDCRVFGSDARIKVPAARPYRYGDALVVCGEVVIEEIQGQQMIVNPLLIVEVLSPSTEAYDRDAKFLAYRSVESFQEYLLVAQDRPYVTRYLRQPDDQWLRADIIGLESAVALESLGVTLPLGEIYRLVNFPPSPPPGLESGEGNPENNR